MESMQDQLAELREKVFPQGNAAAERPIEEMEPQEPDEEETVEDIDTEEPETESEEQEERESAELGESFDVAQLAEAIGVDPEYLYTGLKLSITDGDGKKEQISFSELKDRLQSVDAGGEELVQKRQQFESEYQQFANFANQWATAANTVSEEERAAQGMMAAAEAEFQRIRQLEESDPDKFDRESQRLARKYAVAKNELEQAQQKKAQLDQAQMQQAAMWHGQQLVGRIPEWRNQDLAAKETQAIGEYLVTQGFSPQELQRRIDFRQREIDRKAWLWDKHQNEIQAAKKKVAKAPKTLAPGKGVNRKSDIRKVEKLKQAVPRGAQTDDPSVLNAAKAILKSQR